MPEVKRDMPGKYGAPAFAKSGGRGYLLLV